jgi:hypothetical protein
MLAVQVIFGIIIDSFKRLREQREMTQAKKKFFESQHTVTFRDRVKVCMLGNLLFRILAARAPQQVLHLRHRPV